jgi:hypothetical protein
LLQAQVERQGCGVASSYTYIHRSCLVHADKKKLPVKIENESKREIPQIVNESHQKLNKSSKNKNEGANVVVMLATKSEMRAFAEDPNLVQIVLLY